MFFNRKYFIKMEKEKEDRRKRCSTQESVATRRDVSREREDQEKKTVLRKLSTNPKWLCLQVKSMGDSSYSIWHATRFITFYLHSKRNAKVYLIMTEVMETIEVFLFGKMKQLKFVCQM